jgi:hypothetical protein
MKNKLLNLLLFIGLVLINACSDDEKPNYQLVAGDISVKLPNARVYLVQEGTYNERTYRDYIITDGTAYTGGCAWDVSSYEDATYYVAVELATVNGSTTLTTGGYESRGNWSAANGNQRIAYIYYDNNQFGPNYIIIDSEESPTTSQLINVSGGFENGQNISFSFNGNLRVYKTSTPNRELFTGKLSAGGRINDVREEVNCD